jgi:hypothetical protein
MAKEIFAEGLAMSSEAEEYWQYSRECAKQAVQADTPEHRDQLLDLVRVWTEAALCEEMNAKAGTPVVAQNAPTSVRHG